MAAKSYSFSAPKTGPQDMQILLKPLNHSLMSMWATRVLQSKLRQHCDALGLHWVSSELALGLLQAYSGLL